MRLGSLARKVDDGERTGSDFPAGQRGFFDAGEGVWLATLEQVSVWVGLDVGKESHFADVLDNDGERLFGRAISNGRGDIEALLDRAGKHGIPGLVIDQPGSIAQLVLAVAARRGIPVAYEPGLVMRRPADLYPGEAKTDPLTELRGGLGQVSGRVGSGCLRSLIVIKDGDAPRDLSRLVVPLVGSVEATGDLFEPVRLIDAGGAVVVPAAAFFRELAACGRPAATHRSYGMDVLRWFRFLWAVGVCWDQATSVEGRDFCCWIGLANKRRGRTGVIPAEGHQGRGRRRRGRRTR